MTGDAPVVAAPENTDQPKTTSKAKPPKTPANTAGLWPHRGQCVTPEVSSDGVMLSLTSQSSKHCWHVPPGPNTVLLYMVLDDTQTPKLKPLLNDPDLAQAFRAAQPLSGLKFVAWIEPADHDPTRWLRWAQTFYLWLRVYRVPLDTDIGDPVEEYNPYRDDLPVTHPEDEAGGLCTVQ